MYILWLTYKGGLKVDKPAGAGY